jgi:hypothetical protein
MPAPARAFPEPPGVHRISFVVMMVAASASAIGAEPQCAALNGVLVAALLKGLAQGVRLVDTITDFSIMTLLIE